LIAKRLDSEAKITARFIKAQKEGDLPNDAGIQPHYPLFGHSDARYDHSSNQWALVHKDYVEVAELAY